MVLDRIKLARAWVRATTRSDTGSALFDRTGSWLASEAADRGGANKGVMVGLFGVPSVTSSGVPSTSPSCCPSMELA